MKITIKIRSAYGNTLFDPACDSSKTFCAMLNTKTLTRDALSHIAALGYAIEAQSGDMPDWLAALNRESN
jgi:hypothetical protein